MGIRFACHVCQKPLHIKAELAGKRGVCPQCSTRFRIPTNGAAQSIIIDDVKLDDADTILRMEKFAEPSAALDDALAHEVSGASKPLRTAAESAPTAAAPSKLLAADISRSLLDDPAAVWYVRPPSGGQYGPATGDVLRSWIAEARVTATSLIWRDGWPQWRSAADALAELGASSPHQVTPLSHPSPGKRVTDPVPASPALLGDASIGARKSKVTSRRILIVGGLAALSVTLIGILAYLIRQN